MVLVFTFCSGCGLLLRGCIAVATCGGVLWFRCVVCTLLFSVVCVVRCCSLVAYVV